MLLTLFPTLSSSANQVRGRPGPGPPSRQHVGPTFCVPLQSYAKWLQEVREKAPELMQLPASTESSSVSCWCLCLRACPGGSWAHSLSLLGWTWA